jgi:hypothetical protein
MRITDVATREEERHLQSILTHPDQVQVQVGRKKGGLSTGGGEPRKNIIT